MDMMNILLFMSGCESAEIANKVESWLLNKGFKVSIIFLNHDLEEPLSDFSDVIFIISAKEFQRLSSEQKEILKEFYSQTLEFDIRRMVFFNDNEIEDIGEWYTILLEDYRRGNTVIGKVNSHREIIGHLKWVLSSLDITGKISTQVAFDIENEKKDEKENNQKSKVAEIVKTTSSNITTQILSNLTCQFVLNNLTKCLLTLEQIASSIGIPLGSADVYEGYETHEITPDFTSLYPGFITCLPSKNVTIGWDELPTGKLCKLYKIRFVKESGIEIFSSEISGRILNLNDLNLESGQTYSWYVQTLNNNGYPVDESKKQGLFHILNKTAAELLNSDIQNLESIEDFTLRCFLKGACYRCYGCYLHALQAYKQALDNQQDYLPAVNGIIESLEGSYLDATIQKVSPGAKQWNNIERMYRLRQCIISNNFQKRSQGKCKEC